MQRAVIKRPAKVRIAIEDDSGVLVNADAPPTVTLRDEAGTSVATGASSVVAGSTGRYEFAFTRNTLGVLRAEATCNVGGTAYTWTDTVRMVDRRAMGLAKLRADATLGALSTPDFLEAVDGAEDALETALRFRVVGTSDLVSVRLSRPQRVVRLPGPNFIQDVTEAARDGVEIDVATIEVREDGLELPTAGSWDFLTGGAQTGTWLPGAYTFSLKHGLAETPADIQRAVLILARHNANTGVAFPDRASRIVSAETEIWFARSGPDSWFGIPEVDAVVVKRRVDLPVADNTSW